MQLLKGGPGCRVGGLGGSVRRHRAARRRWIESDSAGGESVCLVARCHAELEAGEGEEEGRVGGVEGGGTGEKEGSFVERHAAQ